MKEAKFDLAFFHPQKATYILDIITKIGEGIYNTKKGVKTTASTLNIKFT